MDTLFVGRELHKFRELTSTNAYLKELCRNATIPEGYTVLAEHQTSGRGQFGNQWQSEGGKNLLISVVLKPVFLNPARHFLLNMSVCLAVADTLNFFHPGFQLKWPNDLLFDARKVGGILIENSISRRIEYSIIGIGLNVNQENFGGLPQATSLRQILGRKVELDYLTTILCTHLEARYLQLRRGEKEELRSQYLQNLYGFHQPVMIVDGEARKMMQITGVEDSGILCALVEGREKRYNFKEISFLLA